MHKANTVKEWMNDQVVIDASLSNNELLENKLSVWHFRCFFSLVTLQTQTRDPLDTYSPLSFDTFWFSNVADFKSALPERVLVDKDDYT